MLWFVPAILVLYLMFPLYHFLMKKSGSTILFTLGILVLWFFASNYLPIRYDMYGFTNRIPVFLLGVMLGRLEKDGRLPKTKLAYLPVLPVFAGGLYAAYYVERIHPFLLVPASNCFLPTLLLAVSVTFGLSFVFEFLHSFRVSARIMEVLSVPLRYWGKASLEFYLVQLFTVGQIITVEIESILVQNLLLIAVVTGTSWLLFTVSGVVNDRLLRFRVPARRKTGEAVPEAGTSPDR